MRVLSPSAVKSCRESAPSHFADDFSVCRLWVSKVHLSSAFYRQNLVIFPLDLPLNSWYTKANPQSVTWCFPHYSAYQAFPREVRLESWDKSKKKKEWRGSGREKKEPLARKPHDFEKLRSPTNAASDWRGAGSVDYWSLETSIKPGMLCFRASQIEN